MRNHRAILLRSAPEQITTTRIAISLAVFANGGGRGHDCQTDRAPFTPRTSLSASDRHTGRKILVGHSAPEQRQCHDSKVGRQSGMSKWGRVNLTSPTVRVSDNATTFDANAGKIRSRQKKFSPLFNCPIAGGLEAIFMSNYSDAFVVPVRTVSTCVPSGR